MDGKHFDLLTRKLADGRTRRSVLGGIAAAAAGLLAAGKAEAGAICRSQGTVCSKNADCCNQLCAPKNRQGRRLCGGCTNDDQCQSNVPICQIGYCDTKSGNQCATSPVADQTPCGPNSVCFSGICETVS